MSRCDSSTSIVSFPASIKSGTNLTQVLYDSIEEPLTAEFKWGTRYTTPMFEPGNRGRIDEVGHGALNTTTMNYNNIVYSLYSAAICSASHNSWLIKNKAANVGDIILIFYKSNPLAKGAYDYIFVVIPIIETSSPSDAPSYLNALGNGGTAPSGGYSLSSCIPSNPQSQFAYYSTCLSSKTLANITKRAMVFLSLDGINVSSSLINAIKSAPGLAGSFSKISDAPLDQDINITSFLYQGGSILSGAEITRYVLTTRALLDLERTRTFDWVKGVATKRDDSQTSYKCAEFDPVKDVNKDGTISIDLASGQILSEVLRERNVVIGAMNNMGATSEVSSNNVIPYLVGSILALFFIFAVIIAVMKYSATNGPTLAAPPVAVTTAAAASAFLTNNGLYIVAGIILILLGATAGYLIAVNK